MARRPTEVLSLGEREEGQGVDRAPWSSDELASRKCGGCRRLRWQDTGSLVEGCLRPAGALQARQRQEGGKEAQVMVRVSDGDTPTEERRRAAQTG